MKELAMELQNELYGEITMQYINSLKETNMKYDQLLSSIADAVEIYNKVDRVDYTTENFLKDLDLYIKKYKNIY